MKRAPAVFSSAAIALLAACPGPDPGNPPELWLAPNGSEVMLTLAGKEPDPF
jgi:hypothetical protein